MTEASALACLKLATSQAPVVQKVDNAIHVNRINHYSVDSVVCFVNTYPLDSAIEPSNNWGLLSITGGRDGTVVKVLTSHQWGPGLTPGPSIIKGLSLLLVLACSKGFSSGSSGFPPSNKTKASKFQFDLETVHEEPLCWMCHC